MTRRRRTSALDYTREEFLKLRLTAEGLQIRMDLNPDVVPISVPDCRLKLLDRLALTLIQAKYRGVLKLLAGIERLAFAS